MKVCNSLLFEWQKYRVIASCALIFGFIQVINKKEVKKGNKQTHTNSLTYSQTFSIIIWMWTVMPVILKFVCKCWPARLQQTLMSLKAAERQASSPSLSASCSTAQSLSTNVCHANTAVFQTREQKRAHKLYFRFTPYET